MKNPMRSLPTRISPTLAAALLFAAVLPALAEDIKFNDKIPAVGDKRESSKKEEFNADVSVSMNGELVGVQAFSSQKVENKVETILAVNGETATKLKVKYGTVKSSETRGEDAALETESPRSGKTFILEVTKDGVVITDENGESPDAETLKEIKKEYKRFGKPDPFSKFLHGKTFKTGEKVEMPKEMVLEMMSNEKLKDAAFSFVITGTKTVNGKKCAVIEVTLTLSGEGEEGMAVSMEGKGEVIADLETSWPFSMTLNGPATISGEKQENGQKISFEGKGSMKMSETFSYSK